MIDEQGRAEGQSKPSQTEKLLEELRSITRLSLADRELLAFRLGEATARLGPQPIVGARLLFERAWGPDNVQWAKRKRYVRFANEPNPEPGDEGSLTSSGQAWAHLLETAATMLSELEAGDASWLRMHHLRRLLYGTVLLPSSERGEGALGNAPELIALLTSKALAKLDNQSRLKELFGVLATAPFWLTSASGYMESGDSDEGRTAFEQNFRASLDDYFSSLRGENRPKVFTTRMSKYLRDDLSWAWPSVRIGALVKTFRHKIFVAPQELCTIAMDLVEEDGVDETSPGTRPARERLENWLSANGGHRENWGGSDEWRLPDTNYTPQNGFGWIELSTEDFRSVYLEVRPLQGSLGLWLSIDYDDSPRLVPQLSGDPIANFIRKRPGWPDFAPWPVDNRFRFHFIDWPPELSEGHSREAAYFMHLSDRDIQPHQTVAFCEDTVWNKWIGDEDFGAWLHDTDHAELASHIFGLDPDTRFVPLESEDVRIPVPCRDGTISAYLLRSVASGGTSPFTALSEQAKAIADAGMGFHENLLERYRALILDFE